MRRLSTRIQKNLKVTFYMCLIILFIYVVPQITKSNSAEVDYTSVKADSVGGDGGDIPAIHKLNQLVRENFLDRDYYEARSFETTSWGGWYANYNKKHQAIFIGMSDGWSYFFYATPRELKMIANRKIPAYKLHQFLKPFPPEYLGEIPTRSRDLFSVF
jgi:hypothetical protein